MIKKKSPPKSTNPSKEKDAKKEPKNKNLRLFFDKNKNVISAIAVVISIVAIGVSISSIFVSGNSNNISATANSFSSTANDLSNSANLNSSISISIAATSNAHAATSESIAATANEINQRQYSSLIKIINQFSFIQFISTSQPFDNSAWCDPYIDLSNLGGIKGTVVNAEAEIISDEFDLQLLHELYGYNFWSWGFPGMSHLEILLLSFEGSDANNPTLVSFPIEINPGQVVHLKTNSSVHLDYSKYKYFYFDRMWNPDPPVDLSTYSTFYLYFFFELGDGTFLTTDPIYCGTYKLISP